MNETLYLNCKKKGFTPRHVCEVGVYFPETSNILGFIKEGVRTTLVEPLPECIEAIKKYFSNAKNVTLLPYAVAESSGELELLKAGASTFASSLSASPALKNDDYDKLKGERIIVNAKRFDDLDDGSIDLISIDVEGSEWMVLKDMKSRPQVISLELKSKHYVNPHLVEIRNWLKQNGYKLWFRDGSDRIFMKKGLLSLTTLEKIRKWLFM